MDIALLAKSILENNERAIAKALTIAEEDPENGLSLLELLNKNSNKKSLKTCIGITGAPGAGKSTLVNALALTLVKQNKKVAILAVDPSSPFSGGALLGDRIRMLQASEASSIFIRSFATRGALGGLSAACYLAAEILYAAGYDYVVIETVGVGQAEVDIVKLTDVCIVVLVPGMGDGVQLLKGGIIEIADIFVINKADKDGVDTLEKELIGIIGLGDENQEIVKTIATTNTGIAALDTAISNFSKNLPNAQVKKMQIIKTQLLQQLLALHKQKLLDKSANFIEELAKEIVLGKKTFLDAVKLLSK